MFYNARQKGFSLPVAIFILVIMALLAAAAVSLMQSGFTGVSREILSTRAFYSAESAAQSTLGQIFPLDGSPASCAASSTINFTTTGLANCSASVSCSSQLIGSTTYYTVTSTGTCSFDNLSAVREVQVLARSPL